VLWDGGLSQGQCRLCYLGLGQHSGSGGGLHGRQAPWLRARDAHHLVLTVAAVRELALGVNLPGVLLADGGIVLVVVLLDLLGTATKVGPVGAAALDTVGGQLGNVLTAGWEGWEVSIVLLGLHALGQRKEL
jgi:hypothetical protein